VKPLRALIDDDGVHVLDGAMGTMLYGQGMFVNVCYDELNLTDPGMVADVHRAYVRAGAGLIETNTFGANPVKLSSFSLDARTEEINRAAARLAREAANDHACVLGAVGPLGIRIEPWGPTAREEAEGFFARQVEGLVQGGVDGFLLETFSDLDELQAAVRAVRRASDAPVFAQMTVNQDGDTSYGTPVETIAATLTGAGVDVLGVNCSVGPAAMLDVVERLAEHTTLPVSAQPNAGLPRTVGDRRIYLASPEYMARYARRMIEAGARFIGGCCGTTPEHIKQIADYVRSTTARPSTGVVAIERSLPDTASEAVPLEQRSALGARLARGEPVLHVEISPPRGWDPEPMLATCRALQEAGAHAVHVVDSARAHGRMGPMPAAIIIERELDLETVVHYTCRDRNMLGMVNDLLGAAAAGLRNILIVTGDPPVTGPYPDATAVFDIDSIGLTNVVHHLNRGVEPGGGAIGTPTQWVIGVALNQSAVDLDRELERFRWKIDAGAEFAITQPVFDPEQLRFCLERLDQTGVPVVAGLWPLTSVRNAEFLANEVPGVSVPPDVIDRMRAAQAGGAEQAQAEGVAIAREVYDAIRPLVQGVQISTPFGHTESALALMDALASPLRQG